MGKIDRAEWKGGEPYGYTGEWYEGYTELLHLRARWLMPYLNPHYTTGRY